MVTSDKSVGVSGDFEILVGSSRACNIRLTTAEVPDIARKHAVLKRVRDHLFIQDFGSKAGTFLDGYRLPKKTWEEIVQKATGYNEIRLGQTQIGIDAQLFRGRHRVGIETTPLYYKVSGKTICNGAYLRAEPGTMTAIMGPAGCGKSMLLDLVNGYRTPTSGQVFVTKNKEFINVHKDYSKVREWLGYLPQDDVMIPELTVYQSLSYCLRLQFIGLATEIREHIIRQTCYNLGFGKDRLNKFLNTVIGSQESGIRGLSGGERKRANLAHELVAMPLILFLDEPTSGLSYVDADKIIRLLKKLTQLDELTMIVTIHQPSHDTFERFDNLLLMNHGGTVAYYGPSQQATPYFEYVTETSSAGRNPAEYLLEILDNPSHNEKLTTCFEQGQLKDKFHFITPLMYVFVNS
ncbi:ATP-binding cassette domain-containing protein [Candidatus Parabeggiatoa sp. HSG14]|uniref:FHA domain-containing protein n=1 Tax=Candidatus Parabeggiatoa sp. HSG14 TaxID=3055593 RepID=UPI0025A70370|nr:ATP-binding cassette domain-containing protein [Thiotrichales bacterium HSG14]